MYTAYGTYAGWIKYTPYTELTENEIRGLQTYILEAGLSYDVENPRTLIDFIYVDQDVLASDVYRKRIVLYQDGGDEGDPVFLLVRFDDQRGGSPNEYVHVVDENVQTDWTDNTFLHKLCRMESAQVQQVMDYITEKLQDETAWMVWSTHDQDNA
jgi:hypothetical protein